jgi:hypothetical protein
MKTLQKCKEAIAKQYGFDNWDRIDFYMLDSHEQTAIRPYAEERLNDEVAELYAEQYKEQNLTNLERFNQIIMEKELQVGSQEVEIRDLKQTLNEQKAQFIGLNNECTYLSNQSIEIDKIVFSEDLSVFEKIQEIQKLLL